MIVSERAPEPPSTLFLGRRSEPRIISVCGSPGSVSASPLQLQRRALVERVHHLVDLVERGHGRGSRRREDHQRRADQQLLPKAWARDLVEHGSGDAKATLVVARGVETGR